MKILTSVVVYFVLTMVLYCQGASDSNNLRMRYGITGSYGLDYHSVNFQKLPGVPNCCPRFENGKGDGFAFGLLFEKPVNSFLIPGLRITYNSIWGKLSDNENSFVSIDNIPTAAVIEHNIDAEFNYLGFEPYIEINVISSLSLFGGLQLAYNVSSNYSQEEELKQPVNRGTFENGLRIRNKKSGEIPDGTKLGYNPFLGLKMSFPLNSSNSLSASPEFLMLYGLSNIVKNLDWKISSWRLGLALTYAPHPSPPLKEVLEKKYNIDTITIKSEDIAKSSVIQGKETTSKEVGQTAQFLIITEVIRRTDTLLVPKSVLLDASVKAVAVNNDGKESDLAGLNIEEFLSTKMTPLLNYIFFENNSSVLPVRYRQITSEEANRFTLKQLFNESTLDVYYDVLNIIGYRMNQEPGSAIHLTGCNSDEGQEKSNILLSEKRAEVVKDYLVRIWKITPARISIVSHNLPEKPSNISKDDGIAENRRVELRSDNFKITEPIMISDTLRVTNPPVIKFYYNCSSDYEIRDWKLNIIQKNQTVKMVSGSGKPPATNQWTLDIEKNTLPTNDNALEFFLELTDIKGHKFSSDKKVITVEQKSITKKKDERIGDKRIDKFSLILFDYNESSLNKENLSITKIIKNSISKNSNVLIEGFTDRIGEPDYNLQLSQGRAKSVEKALNLGLHSTSAFGSSKFLYNNDLPEGRFYCRTVNVTIETPIEK